MDYYIFLDIDGVLNNEIYFKQCYALNGGYAMHMNHAPFSPYNLTCLMELVKQIRMKGKCKIILSSTWRLHNEDCEIVATRLAEYGLSLDDKTPIIGQHRGKEIQDFLKDKEEYKFVILDDDCRDINEVYPEYLVQINRYCGLEWNDCQKALEILDIN